PTRAGDTAGRTAARGRDMDLPGTERGRARAGDPASAGPSGGLRVRTIPLALTSCTGLVTAEGKHRAFAPRSRGRSGAPPGRKGFLLYVCSTPHGSTIVLDGRVVRRCAQGRTSGARRRGPRRRGAGRLPSAACARTPSGPSSSAAP